MKGTVLTDQSTPRPPLLKPNGMKARRPIEASELETIIAFVFDKYGYDFSGYARASLQRRVNKIAEQLKAKDAQELMEMLRTDDSHFASFLETVTVNVTALFRDPAFFVALREQVFPMLATYPIIKVWSAGCATGEEAYSLAILLQEAGLYQRTRIYATDLNPGNLETARKGIIPLHYMKQYTQNYQLAGGQRDFSNYYTAHYDHALLHKDLRRHILFSQHNLVTDQVFNEFQLILCRNVLIYFNKELQDKVLQLFYYSLGKLGYLALGAKESLLFTRVRPHFETIDQQHRIFRKKN